MPSDAGAANSQAPSAQRYRKPTNMRTVDPTLQPVPDPDAEGTKIKANGAPELLNPNDQTASRSLVPRRAIAPIAWPVPPSKPIPVPQVERPTPKKKWDDSGWRAVRR